MIGPFDTHRDPDPEPNLGSWRRLVAANPDAVAFETAGEAWFKRHALEEITRDARRFLRPLERAR